MENNQQKIERLKNIVNNPTARIVFLGGAGVSTESGIPDFRSKDGLYSQKYKYSPEYMLSHDCFISHPKDFYAFYKEKMDCRNYEPNITHRKLAELEEKGRVIGIITQNIDGLHQKAGSKNVIEIHGTTKRNYCNICGKEFDENYVFDYDGPIPRCDCRKNVASRGFVKPDVVLYGENIKRYNDSVELIHRANVLIVGGTSLNVYPAAGLLSEFTGEHIIIINYGDFEMPLLNPESDFVINDKLGNVFSQL